VARSSSRAAYLRGAFLGAGSLSLGRSPHLELRTTSLESSALLVRLASAEGVELALADRPTHAVAYAKSWEAIESLLAVMGASETVLALEERAVVAETRSRANRLANADHANLVRTSLTARRQIAAIARLDLDTVPDELRDVAELRLRHPTASLRELAARADPPLTKVAAHRRLRRLEELAE